MVTWYFRSGSSASSDSSDSDPLAMMAAAACRPGMRALRHSHPSKTLVVLTFSTRFFCFCWVYL
jgi:hypothetical protein